MGIEIISDASAIVAYVTLEEQTTWVTPRLEDCSSIHILDLTYYEVANAIIAKGLKKEISKGDIASVFKEAESIMNECRIHSFIEVIQNAIELARDHSVTTYDAAYLSLSKELNFKLVTTDNKFANKLKNTPYYKLIEHPA